MKRVTVIVGIFFHARDPVALRAWYQKHLGIDVSEWGGAAFSWADADGKPTQFRVWIDPNLILLFAGNTFTSHAWEIYRDLSPVARRLADYIESHKHPYSLGIEKFRQMCGSADTSATSWRQTVKRACVEVEQKGDRKSVV